MKWLEFLIAIFPLILFLSVDCYSQVRIQYENPEIYVRESPGQMPTYRGEFNDSGYLIVDAEGKSITMKSDTRESRTFNFFDINKEPVTGHYLGFGDNTMHNFIPEERLLILMYRQNHLYSFNLSSTDTQELITEYDSN